MRVLVVEDSRHLMHYLCKALRNAGYAVDSAGDGEEGLYLACNHDYDAVILDLMLPKLDGLSILRKLRQRQNQTHIMILTAKSTVDERVEGLQEGADDYVTKPFDLKELLARIQALIRRKYVVKSKELSIGELVLHTVNRTVHKNGMAIDLRPREYALLEFLALQRGKTVSRSEIESHVYDDAKELMSNVVDSSICQLRKKIDSLDGRSYIKTVHRRGYVFDNPNA